MSYGQLTNISTNSNHNLHQFDGVSFKGKMWIIGGVNRSSGLSTAEVWSSVGGVNWTQESSNGGFGIRHFHKCLVYDNKVWIFGGRNATADLNDVWYSTDCRTWTRATAAAGWTARHAMSMCVYNNKMWLAGGFASPSFKNDVWWSSDGATWTQTTASAAWTARQQAGLVAHPDGKMWLYAGYGAAGSGLQDTYSSTDGITWTLGTSSMGMVGGGRYGTTATCELNGKMWLFGGYSYTTSVDYNDIYCSSDGITWSRTTGESWTSRYFANIIVHRNMLHLLGGSNAVNGTIADDWIYIDSYPSARLRLHRGMGATISVYPQTLNRLRVFTGTKKAQMALSASGNIVLKVGSHKYYLQAKA